MNTKDSANSGHYPLELALLQGESRVFKQLLLLGGNSFNNWENKKVEISTEENSSKCLPSLSSSSSLPTPSFSPLSSSSSPLIPPPPFALLVNKFSRNILHTAVIGGQISSLNYLLKWIYETETDGKTVKNGEIIRGEKEISNYTPKENKESDESNENEGKSKNNSEKVEQNTHSPSLSRLLGGRDGDGRTPLELAEHLNKV
jgi:hypothetical protein